MYVAQSVLTVNHVNRDCLLPMKLTYFRHRSVALLHKLVCIILHHLRSGYFNVV